MQKRPSKKSNPRGIFQKRTQNPSRILALFFDSQEIHHVEKHHFSIIHQSKNTIFLIQQFLIARLLAQFSTRRDVLELSGEIIFVEGGFFELRGELLIVEVGLFELSFCCC